MKDDRKKQFHVKPCKEQKGKTKNALNITCSLWEYLMSHLYLKQNEDLSH